MSSIKKLFPESSNHQSIVRTIDEKTRLQVGIKFPQLPLHFTELGQHTLYVVMDGDRAIGMVHVRSEQSPWGLVEIAWAMHMDLTVKDFLFQRCRNKQKKLLNSADFKLQFIGQSFEEINTLYDETTNNGIPEFLKTSSGAHELATVVLKCALKTLLVTRLGWQEDITHFTSAALIKQLPPNDGVHLSIINNIMDETTLKRLLLTTGTENLGIKRTSVIAFTLTDKNGHLLGLLYQGLSTIDTNQVVLSWLLDMQGNVIAVDTDTIWPSQKIETLFKSTYFRSFLDVDQCANRAELYALEVATTMQPFFENRAH